MAIDLATMNESESVMEQLSIEPVRTKLGVDAWIDVWGFGAPPSFLPIAQSLHGQLLLSDDSPFQYFVGYIGQNPSQQPYYPENTTSSLISDMRASE